jgi:DNA invertase Pin-like site-specific DNA recombinase/predicted nucleic acid-binding protein
VGVISDSGGHQSGYSAERDGWKALLAAIRSGHAGSVVVYDLSRLGRNARLMLDLKHELERHQVPLLVANMPGAAFHGATGSYMFAQLCSAAQLQRDLDSERMSRMQRRLFEDGFPRGHDAFGYRSARDDAGTLVRPRRWEIVPEEAEVVRRVFRELTRLSLVEVAKLMDSEGVPHRGNGWTRESVKDIVRRERVYLGFVVEKRGRDERPGRHDPILTEEEARRTRDAIAGRTRAGRKPGPYRTYVLRGLLTCSCGAAMRGWAHAQHGRDIRYYRCPMKCGSRQVRADAIEADVLARIAVGILPDRVVDRARSELRKRVETPEIVSAGRQRERLTKRLEALQKQHAWGDLEDAVYCKARDETMAALARLPDGDRVIAFDSHRARVLALRDAIAATSPARQEELRRIVVENVVVHDREVTAITWTPPLRPFLAIQQWYPQGGSSTRLLSDEDDVLAWYVA